MAGRRCDRERTARGPARPHGGYPVLVATPAALGASNRRQSARLVGRTEVERRPRRVERCRWVLAAAVVGLLTALGLGYLIGVWVAALVIVGAHEAGHAIAARGLGVPAGGVVVGLGPRLFQLQRRGLRVDVRALPVVGWVELDREAEPLGSARVAAVYAAGPLASLALGIVVMLAASVCYQGPTNLSLTDVRSTVGVVVESATTMWSAPFERGAALIRSTDDAERLVTVTGQGRSTTRAQEQEGGEDEVVSVVGVVASTPTQVSDYGGRWVFAMVALLSGSVAGLNLVPAWGLDGHGLLSELAWLLDRRSRSLGRLARCCVAVVGVVSLVLLLWVTVGAVFRDLADFL